MAGAGTPGAAAAAFGAMTESPFVITIPWVVCCKWANLQRWKPQAPVSRNFLQMMRRHVVYSPLSWVPAYNPYCCNLPS